MKHHVILTASALPVLIFSGLVHGLWTDRWSDQVDLSEAARRLPLVPYTVGEWQGKDVPTDDDDRSGLAGSMTRRYTSTVTGKAVTLYLACGRPGPVSIHTPDVCYRGVGFDAEKKQKFQPPGDAAPAPPEFWTARFAKENRDGKTTLRIFWSWLTAGGWRVAENPRLAFAGERLLHKMYLVHELTSPDDPADGDPCAEFLREMLPQLQQTLYAEQR